MGRRLGNQWLTQLLAIALAMPVVAQQLPQSGGNETEIHDDVSEYLAAIRAPALRSQKLDDLYRSATGELANGNYAAAEADYRDLYTQNPRNTRGLEGVALVFLSEQRPVDAVTLMQNELDKSPQRIDILLAFVRIAVKTKAYDAATKALSRALTTSTLTAEASSELYVKLSEVSAAQGDGAESLAALQMANRLSPRDVLIAMSLGQALEARGELSEAAKTYRAALGIDPQDGPALAACASKNTDPPEHRNLALGCAVLAVKMQPQDSATADLLGLIYLRKGLPDKALPVYERLLLDHPDPRYVLHYAMALATTGQKARADDELRRALEMNPNSITELQIRGLLAGK